VTSEAMRVMIRRHNATTQQLRSGLFYPGVQPYPMRNGEIEIMQLAPLTLASTHTVITASKQAQHLHQQHSSTCRDVTRTSTCSRQPARIITAPIINCFLHQQSRLQSSSCPSPGRALQPRRRRRWQQEWRQTMWRGGRGRERVVKRRRGRRRRERNSMRRRRRRSRRSWSS